MGNFHRFYHRRTRAIGTRHRNAAPFKRNDRMLEALPIGVVVFPGSGISANLADKAKKLGIPVWRFDKPAPATTASAARAVACVQALTLSEAPKSHKIQRNPFFKLRRQLSRSCAGTCTR